MRGAIRVTVVDNDTDEQREVEITFAWDDIDYDILDAVYTDTGKPYEGDCDVWNDDIQEWIGSNPDSGAY